MLLDLSAEETYYVQNITLGYYSVSDIALTFGPREIKNLKWEKADLIKTSGGLVDAMEKGFLRRLSKDECEKTKNMQYQKEKKEMLREMQNKPEYEKFDTGNKKEVLAETFDVSKGSSKRKEKLDFSGNANDSLSYVTAFEIAEAQAYERGDQLSAEEFGDIVTRDPEIIGRLLKGTNLAANNTEINHRVYFNTPPGDHIAGNSGVASDRMANLRRDGRMAGMSDMQMSDQFERGDAMVEDNRSVPKYDFTQDKAFQREADQDFYNLRTGNFDGEEDFAEEIVIEED